jgi:hypothetical protein
MKKDKWVKRWKVNSDNGNGEYTVAVDLKGNYGCSCPVWKFRRQECKHIIQIKELNPDPEKEITEEEREDALIKGYAKKGYRYYTWVNDGTYHARETLEILKRKAYIEKVKTFMIRGIRYVLIKEKPEAYEQEFKNFIKLLQGCNFRKRIVKNPFNRGFGDAYWLKQNELRMKLRKLWFDITQHIVFNSNGVINPNLPDGSVYKKGSWGQRIVNINKHYKHKFCITGGAN